MLDIVENGVFAFPLNYKIPLDNVTNLEIVGNIDIIHANFGPTIKILPFQAVFPNGYFALS
jgi:hypothetical protein